MVYIILGVVFIKLLTQLLLVCAFSAKLVTHCLESFYIVFEHLLVLSLVRGFLRKVLLKSIQLFLVLLGNRTDQHAVVRFAAVLEQDGEHFPDVCNHRVLLLGVLKALLDQFVKAYRVDEQGSVNAVDSLAWHTGVDEVKAGDAVARRWVLVFRLQNDAWDVEVLCVL